VAALIAAARTSRLLVVRMSVFMLILQSRCVSAESVSRPATYVEDARAHSEQLAAVSEPVDR